MPDENTMQDPYTAQPAPADDKAHGDKLENAIDAAISEPPGGAPPAQDPSSDQLDPQQRLLSEVAELKNAWIRARADLENARKQASLDVLKAHKFAVERFAEDLLPVADSLEQALSVANATPEQLRSGVELTLRQLQAAFGRAQLVQTDPAGQKFDPHQHQAMQMVGSDLPANTVVQVFQKGYVLNERVLRPALVTVAKGAPGGDSAT